MKLEVDREFVAHCLKIRKKSQFKKKLIKVRENSFLHLSLEEV